MAKQTAVDLFHDGIIDLLRNASVNTNTVAKLWMKYKPVEREQIIQAWMTTDHELQRIAAERYYEQTYGKEATDANG